MKFSTYQNKKLKAIQIMALKAWLLEDWENYSKHDGGNGKAQLHLEVATFAKCLDDALDGISKRTYKSRTRHETSTPLRLNSRP